MNPDTQLIELGERRIIGELLATRYGSASDYFGNDCAIAHLPSGDELGAIVATTDPCPEPMAAFLGYTDNYYRGWLLATINLSDLAAAGARPLGLLTSLVLPNDLTVEQFGRLLDGIDHCCASVGTRVIGGNVKEGTKVDISATALGICADTGCMSRVGCNVGDLVVVIGDLGLFWAGVLATRNGLKRSPEQMRFLLRNVLTPQPKNRIGEVLGERNVMTACMDNSDGLYPSLAELAAKNGVQFRVSLDDSEFDPNVLAVSAELELEPVRLAMGWGDWQLVGCVSPERMSELVDLGRLHATPIQPIGHVASGSGVILQHKGKTGPLAKIDSQRFAKDSWFTAGIESYIEMLTLNSLWEN